MTVASPAVPAVIGGKYRVVRELGRGGFGAVYLVEHANTGEQLALKVLYGRAAADPMSLERFKREARAPARIKSENVVRVVDADAAPELGGAPFLVMELLEGKDVEQLAEARGALLPEEVVAIVAQAARALDKAHALGIVHRDLKPENMFLHRREDGTVILKILDFGISKSLGEATGEPASVGMTSTGAVLGTPLYMAPEQARGLASSIAPTTDVWAVGLIAYRLLTGSIYWTANTVADLLVQIVAFEMPPPSSKSVLLPPSFDAWFARSCHRDASLRFQSVGEQSRALAVALGVESPELPSLEVAPLSALRSPGVTPPPHAPSGRGFSTGAALAHTQAPPKARAKVVVGAAVVGVVVLLGAAASAVVFARKPTDTPTPVSGSSPSATPTTSITVTPAASASASASANVPPGAVAPAASSALVVVTPVGAVPARPGKADPARPADRTAPATSGKPATPKRFDPDAP